MQLGIIVTPVPWPVIGPLEPLPQFQVETM